MKLVFQSEHFEEHKISDESLIRLLPYGMTLAQDPSRPTFLLKDKAGEHVLPLTLTPMEAGLAVQQSSQVVLPSTPHRVLSQLLDSMSIKITKCVFVEIRGNLQYVRLFLENHPTHGSLKVRADEALSLCLHLNVPLYATKKFMNRSRVMNAESEGLADGLQLNPAILTRNHEYLL